MYTKAIILHLSLLHSPLENRDIQIVDKVEEAIVSVKEASVVVNLPVKDVVLVVVLVVVKVDETIPRLENLLPLAIMAIHPVKLSRT